MYQWHEQLQQLVYVPVVSSVANALEAVRERPVTEAQQLLQQAKGTVLLHLSLLKAGRNNIEVGTVKGKQQATEVLRALLEFGKTRFSLLLMLLL